MTISAFQVLRGGPGLAFIVYPEVLTRMTASNLWSALFFAMLISLALGCIFGAFETVVSAVSDQGLLSLTNLIFRFNKKSAF